ncbi:hypothetical protein [Tautonia rosea]|uniref:hypothetical protein n=1 Tax=Tautonia rosea TaxID=2728037 RepID=UPI0014761BB0|nr:hypothetical protein [Tautonia rosea]
MLDQMADQVLTMADDFAEGGFQVNEFLEMHGSRLHFLCLMISQFEMLRETRNTELKARAKASERPKSPERRMKRREEPLVNPGTEESPRTSGEESGTDL